MNLMNFAKTMQTQADEARTFARSFYFCLLACIEQECEYRRLRGRMLAKRRQKKSETRLNERLY